MPFLTGTRLGSFEILSLLGAGGMGEVYRARDLQLGRDVAVKVLLNLSRDPDRLRRFEQEARAAAALNHPNILAVYHMGTHKEAPYLVSELLEGESLRAVIKRGPLSARKVVDYGVQIARGLQAAHERGIVHRDLKPENLFLTRDGRVKILDFGLAKLTQPLSASDAGSATEVSLTQTGIVMGTVGYMSPEQVKGAHTDHRTDIFAFGAVLYEMLVGKRAFQKSSATETMAAILWEDPPDILDAAPSVPVGLERIVHRCLEREPQQRFQSAADLAFALESALDTPSGSRGTIVASPPPRPGLAPTLVLPTQPAVLDRTLAMAPIADNRTVLLQTPQPPAQPVKGRPRRIWPIPAGIVVIALAAILCWQWPKLRPATNPVPPSPDAVALPKSAQPKSPRSAVPREPRPKSPAAEGASDAAPPDPETSQQAAQRKALTQQAQTALDAGDDQSAIDLCTQILAAAAGSQPCASIRQRASSQLAEKYVSQGMAQWEKGDFDAAGQSADRALQLDPANQNAIKLKKLAMQMKNRGR